MEMDTARRRRLLLMILGLILALIAGGAAYMLGSQGTGEAEVETESVLVAARDIPARQVIVAEDVVVREVPVDAVLTQALREAGPVQGRLASVPIYADQQITPNLFVTAVEDAEYSILDPDEVVTADSPQWRAVSVQVPPNRAVGGTILQGQRVDLFVTVEFAAPVVFNTTTGEYEEVDTATVEGVTGGMATKITLQDLLVLKSDPENEMYVLRVDLNQAEEISHVAKAAPDSFSLVLRPEQDTRVADSNEFGETTDRLIMQYVYPVPLLVDLEQLLGFPIAPVEGEPDTDEPDQPDEPQPTPEPDLP
jgi:Flp pilus assembly protein CpaB